MNAPPERHPGRRIVLAFLVAVVICFGVLLFFFWSGPKGQFTATSRSTEPQVPAIVRVFCIDPARPGPVDLPSVGSCANRDRLEFTLKLLDDRQKRIGYAFFGPGGEQVATTAVDDDDWTGSISLKDLTPGAYALYFFFSEADFDEAALREALAHPANREDLIPRHQTIAKFADGSQRAGALRHQRIALRVEAPAGEAPTSAP